MNGLLFLSICPSVLLFQSIGKCVTLSVQSHLASIFSCFFKMGQSWPLFVYFLPFLIIISIIQIEKSVDGILGIQTRGRRIMAQTKPRSYGGLYLLNYSPFLLQPSSQPVIELPYVCFDVNCRFSWSSSCDAGRRVRRTRRQPTEKIGKRGAA